MPYDITRRMAPPILGHVKKTIYVPPEWWEALAKEAKERKLSIGQILQEAMAARVVKVTRR